MNNTNNNKVPNGYVNEGFLFINNNTNNNTHNNTNNNTNTKEENKHFEKGKIIDIDGKLVCLGEIIYNNSRKEFLDCVKKKYIIHYSPLYKGTRIRIYWHIDKFNISTINEIYPKIDFSKYSNQINYDLLDKNICYYAILSEEINDIHNTIILTYMVEMTKKIKKNNACNINLKIPVKIPSLTEDLAFENHLEIFDCQYPLVILDQLQLQIHGLIFYSNRGKDSEVFEFRK